MVPPPRKRKSKAKRWTHKKKRTLAQPPPGTPPGTPPRTPLGTPSPPPSGHSGSTGATPPRNPAEGALNNDIFVLIHAQLDIVTAASFALACRNFDGIHAQHRGQVFPHRRFPSPLNLFILGFHNGPNLLRAVVENSIARDLVYNQMFRMFMTEEENEGFADEIREWAEEERMYRHAARTQRHDRHAGRRQIIRDGNETYIQQQLDLGVSLSDIELESVSEDSDSNSDTAYDTASDPSNGSQDLSDGSSAAGPVPDREMDRGSSAEGDDIFN